MIARILPARTASQDPAMIPSSVLRANVGSIAETWRRRLHRGVGAGDELIERIGRLRVHNPPGERKFGNAAFG